MQTRRGVRDLEIHNYNTQQLKAQMEAILKIVHTLESKGIDMTDEEIANLARVSPEQVKYVRRATQRKEVTVAGNDSVRSMIDEMKKDILATLRDEVSKISPVQSQAVKPISAKVVIKEAVLDKEEAPRPTIKSSVADVFSYKEGTADIKMAEGSTQVESVSNQLDMLKNLKLGKK